MISKLENVIKCYDFKTGYCKDSSQLITDLVNEGKKIIEEFERVETEINTRDYDLVRYNFVKKIVKAAYSRLEIEEQEKIEAEEIAKNYEDWKDILSGYSESL